jgi:hypothetical protein
LEVKWRRDNLSLRQFCLIDVFLFGGEKAMNTSRIGTLLSLLLVAASIAACSPAATQYAPAAATEAPAVEMPVEVVQTVVVQVQAEQPAAEAPGAEDKAGPAAAATAVLYSKAAGGEKEAAGRARLIIKDGQIKLLVKDTDVALDRATQVVDDLGGYIVSSRAWYEAPYGENFKFVTMTIAVPVDRFEQSLRRLRELAIRVLDENASGQDVTDEYVDLESRLKNLEATRDRIREFLVQAKTVKEALEVNSQLSEVEDQIEQVQGRMNYLFDRAAYSTLTIDIQPEIIQPTPTVTPSPTPTLTPTVTPTPTPWSIAPTFKDASGSLVTVSRALAQLTVWLGVVLVPLLLPLALVVLVIWLILRHRRNVKEKPAGGEQQAG